MLSAPHECAGDLSHGKESCQFPLLTEAAHFHYDDAKLASLFITVKLCKSPANLLSFGYEIGVWCGHAAWSVRKTLQDVLSLDHQLHVCLFDRSFSQLPTLSLLLRHGVDKESLATDVVEKYFKTLVQLINDHENSVNCSLILSWFEMDNKGKHLVYGDLRSLNIPAVAAAQVVKRHLAESKDELNIDVGDLISVIDMPSPNESAWWRGKKGYKVGFFPHKCVVVIDTKLAAESAATTAVLATEEKSHSGGVLSSRPVLKNHGKIVTCLQVLFRERPTRDYLRQSGIVFERVFGCDLGQYLANYNQDVPLVVRWCAEIIEKFGIVDGVYRHSGGAQNINALRAIFDGGKLPSEDDPKAKDPHAVSCLMKTYFRELPNPLLTHAFYFDFINAVDNPSESAVLKAVFQLLQCLPPPHHRTLKFLLGHLSRVASHFDATGMTAKNLAIVWAPNILRPFLMSPKEALTFVSQQARVAEILISYYVNLFDQQSSTSVNSSIEKPSQVLGNRNESIQTSQPVLLSLDVAQKLYSKEPAVIITEHSNKGDAAFKEEKKSSQKRLAVASSSSHVPSSKSDAVKRNESSSDKIDKADAEISKVSKKRCNFNSLKKSIGNHGTEQKLHQAEDAPKTSLRVSHSDDNLRESAKGKYRASLKKLAAIVRDNVPRKCVTVDGRRPVLNPAGNLTKLNHLSSYKSSTPHVPNRSSVWRNVPRSKSVSSPESQADDAEGDDFVSDLLTSLQACSLSASVLSRTPDEESEQRRQLRCPRWPLTSDNSMVWTGSQLLTEAMLPTVGNTDLQACRISDSKKAFLVRGPAFSPQCSKRHRSADELAPTENGAEHGATATSAEPLSFLSPADCGSNAKMRGHDSNLAPVGIDTQTYCGGDYSIEPICGAVMYQSLPNVSHSSSVTKTNINYINQTVIDNKARHGKNNHNKNTCDSEIIEHATPIFPVETEKEKSIDWSSVHSVEYCRRLFTAHGETVTTSMPVVLLSNAVLDSSINVLPNSSSLTLDETDRGDGAIAAKSRHKVQRSHGVTRRDLVSPSMAAFSSLSNVSSSAPSTSKMTGQDQVMSSSTERGLVNSINSNISCASRPSVITYDHHRHPHHYVGGESKTETPNVKEMRLLFENSGII